MLSPFCRYCTEILASLPFTCPDEPLYLIYDINRVIQVRAGSLEANMKTWSSFSQQRDSVKFSSENQVEAEPEVHYLSEHIMTVTPESISSNTCSISKEDLQKFQVITFSFLFSQITVAWMLSMNRLFLFSFGNFLSLKQDENPLYISPSFFFCQWLFILNLFVLMLL